MANQVIITGVVEKDGTAVAGVTDVSRNRSAEYTEIWDSDNDGDMPGLVKRRLSYDVSVSGNLYASDANELVASIAAFETALESGADVVISVAYKSVAEDGTETTLAAKEATGKVESYNDSFSPGGTDPATYDAGIRLKTKWTDVVV